MPAKTWTSQVDFEAGTLTNVVATGGTLALAVGESEGTWKSEWYQAPAWDRHSRIRMTNTVPEGTNIYFRFRSDTTANDGASWSDYYDAILTDDSIIFDLATWYKNNPGASTGEYFQIEVTLLAE